MKHKNIAIGGSAADPPHLGHFLLINELFNLKRFDKIVWILSGNREDKDYNVSADDRVAMTELMFSAYRSRPEFTIVYSDVYKGNTPTISWINKFKLKFPKANIFWYTGSDVIINKQGKCEIKSEWEDGDLLIEETNFLVFHRASYARPIDLPSNFEILDIELPNIASSEIRSLIQKKESFEHLVTPAVYEYIREHELYGYINYLKE